MQPKLKILCYLFCFFAFSFQKSSSKEIEEYNAKALFIYNFTKYIEWQDLDETSDFNIGVYQKCDILEPLKVIAYSKKIQNKKINIHQFNDQTKELNCNILFISDNTSNDSYINLIKKTNRKNLLIISESKKIFQLGSSINFLIQNNKIKFEINLQAIEKADLKISSQLLKLAVKVRNE
jgi:hypothetical protein